MQSRTFGWIQDAGRLDQLRKAVEIFDIGMSEKIDVSKSRKPIGKALNIGRWADENYTRFAQALGFIEYDRAGDDFSITQLGLELLKTRKGTKEEKEIFEQGLLTYPPATRILELLATEGHLTKFEIGKKIGFQGEKGFPTYPIELFIKEYSKAKTNKEKNKIVSNKESTADKYARMICHYLIQVGWIESIPKDLEYKEGNVAYKARTPHAFVITDKGKVAFRRTKGSSTQRKIEKHISYEMLSSGKQPGYNQLRHRRTLILEFLVKKKKLISIDEIISYLSSKKVIADLTDIHRDIFGFINCGISIERVGNQFQITDHLELDIPEQEVFELRSKELVQKIISKMLKSLKSVPDEYIQKLITESFIGDLNQKFENTVFQLFNKIIGFDGEKLGGPHKPDSLLWYEAKLKGDSYGLVVDAKSREDYFRIGIAEVDKMRRYLEDFSDQLIKKHKISRIHFLWVSSGFKGMFKYGIDKLNSKTNAKGALISSQNSLILAENVALSNRANILGKIEPLFICLDEIKEDKIVSIIKND